MRKKHDCKDTWPGIQPLKALRFLLPLLGLLIATGWGPVNGQNTPGPRTISGRVLTRTGDAIPGVTIQVRGTRVMTTTDPTGKFSIYAKEGDVLEISTVGYRTIKVTVGKSNTVGIALDQDFGHMDDVVVVGYGQMKRTDLSSAQTTVTSKDIQETVNTTMDQALQGRAAGVYVSSPSGQPGAGANVVIRGISSVTGPTQPLYVIDGVQIRPADFSDDPNSHPTGFANALSGINPDDIESMNILEGPAATAIFGSAGANGVIMITTKHGKAGETRISASTTWSVQDKPKELSVMNLQEYATFRNEAAAAGGAPRHRLAGRIVSPDADGETHPFRKRRQRQNDLLPLR
jgi:TonB-dependent starch-binding outer membrane protein SusC